MNEQSRPLPSRWVELDPRTIEFIARLNEHERDKLIQVGNLSEKEVKRLCRFLALDDDKWEAGFKIVTRAVVMNKILVAMPRLVFWLAAISVAINQIWTNFVPWIIGGRP